MVRRINTSRFISTLLDTNGDGTGSVDGAINAAGAPVDFFLRAPDPNGFALTRLQIILHNGGALNQTGYGNLAPLTNGIELLVRDVQDSVYDRLDIGVPMTSNMGLAAWGTNSGSEGWGSGGNAESFSISELSFPMALDREIEIPAGHDVVWRLNDNFAALNGHWCHLYGYLIAG